MRKRKACPVCGSGMAWFEAPPPGRWLCPEEGMHSGILSTSGVRKKGRRPWKNRKQLFPKKKNGK